VDEAKQLLMREARVRPRPRPRLLAEPARAPCAQGGINLIGDAHVLANLVRGGRAR
jgi:hypothetical protein